MCQLSPVPFHGDIIFCIDYQNQPYTPMRPIVENMGLDWGGQAVKLKANKDRWTVEMISTVAQDGVEREMLSMPVRKLPAWLNSVNPKKVRPELRSRIELYQNESDDALWAYWMEGQAVRKPSPALPEAPHIKITPSTTASRKPLRSLVNAWAQVSGTPHTALWPQVKAHFQLERIDDLPEEWIPDAIAWVQGKIDEQRKALPPSPGSNLQQSHPAPALAITDEIDVHLAAIREHIRHINDHEEAIFQAVRKGMPPLSGTGPRSSLALLIHRNMENAGWSLHYALKSMEASARTALAAGRI